MKFGTNVLHVNTHWVTESHFRSDVTLSRGRPWRHYMQKSVGIWLVHTKHLPGAYAAASASSCSIQHSCWFVKRCSKVEANSHFCLLLLSSSKHSRCTPWKDNVHTLTKMRSSCCYHETPVKHTWQSLLVYNTQVTITSRTVQHFTAKTALHWSGETCCLRKTGTAVWPERGRGSTVSPAEHVKVFIVHR